MIGQVIRKLRDNPWLAPALTILAFLLYSLQAWTYAHILTSFVDEGGYLYVGDLYARGLLRPFQDYGPTRQYAPLAFLIPGQIEQWFGVSLNTGRLFSIFCALMMLVALWLIARRFGGKWWGAFVILAIALTPISIQIYSLALSQALVACLTAWSLFFVLGEKRLLWQIIVGSILSGLVVMTRQNLVLFPLLLVAYIFWQHGKKAGWWAILGSLTPILIIHIIYWPNIQQMWVIWLPPNLFPFLKAFQLPGSIQTQVAFPSFSATMLSFLQGYRFHYFSMLGFIVCLFLWPHNDQWKNQTDKRTAYFLATLFLSMMLLHAWGSIFSTNSISPCTFCFTPYLAFFDFSAILLIIVSFPSLRKKASLISQIAMLFVLLLLSSGLGYAAYDRFGAWLLNAKFPAFNRGLNPHLWVPFITLWDILSNKFHLDYWNSRTPLAIVAGFIFGGVALVIGWFIYKSRLVRNETSSLSFGPFILLSAVGLGVLLSPLMGGTYRQDGICPANIPQTYEQIGSTLAKTIPIGSQVYWESFTAVPLLYAPGITVHPPQIYGAFSVRNGGDPQQLLKNGFYNTELAKQWRAEADFIVIEEDWLNPTGGLGTSEVEVSRTAPTNPCVPNSSLIIYKREPNPK